MSRIDRTRQLALAVPFPAPPTPDAAFVGRVCGVGGGPYSMPGLYVSVNPVAVSGAESEGGPGTLAADATIKVVVDILRGTPAIGDYLICHYEGDRWIAEKQGSGHTPIPPTVAIPDCFCPVPRTLKMTSSDPAANQGMFQPCTISYQATPSWAATLGLGPNIFLSNGSFYDQVLKSTFYYYLWCQYYGFNLTRLYPTSPYGSPYRDSLLYSWSIGAPGNTCDPFALDGGGPYPGSSQVQVTINP